MKGTKVREQEANNSIWRQTEMIKGEMVVLAIWAKSLTQPCLPLSPCSHLKQLAQEPPAPPGSFGL